MVADRSTTCPLFFLRGRPVCLPGCSLLVYFVRTHRCAPTIPLLFVFPLPVGADRCVCPVFLCLCVFGRTRRCAPTFVAVCYAIAVGADRCVCPVVLCLCFWALTSLRPCICLSLCSFVLLPFSVGADRCVCPAVCLCVLGAHIVAPYNSFVFLFLCLIAFFRRGRPGN